MKISKFIESANRVLDIWEYCTRHHIKTMSEMSCVQINNGWNRDDIKTLVEDVKILGSKHLDVFKELTEIKNSPIEKMIDGEIARIQIRAKDASFYDKNLLLYFFPYDDNDAELNRINNDLAELFLHLYEGLISINEMFADLAGDEDFEDFSCTDDSPLLKIFKGNQRILDLFLKRIAPMKKGTDIVNELIALKELGRIAETTNDILREELSKVKDKIPQKSAFNSAFVVDSMKRKNLIIQAKEAYKQ